METIRLEKETDLIGKTQYYIMTDDGCIAAIESETEANRLFEIAEKNLKEFGGKQREVIKEYTLKS